MARARVRTKGGHRLKAVIRKAKTATGKSVEVGFFETARYPPVRTGKNGGQKQEPHYVATVAAWNEFGTRGGGRGGPTPERPFFRQALERVPPTVREIVRAGWNPEKPGVNARTAGLVGEAVKGEIQASIRNLRSPPNAPWTIKMKGSSNPLVENQTMVNNVGYMVTD